MKSHASYSFIVPLDSSGNYKRKEQIDRHQYVSSAKKKITLYSVTTKLTKSPLCFVHVVSVSPPYPTPAVHTSAVLHVSRVIISYPAFPIKLHGKVLLTSFLRSLIALVD